MPDPQPPSSDFPTATNELLVMSVRIIGALPTTAPRVIEAALDDPAFLKAIEAELEARAKEMLAAGTAASRTGGVVSTGQIKETGDKLLVGLQGIAKDQFATALIDAAKATPEYKKLELQLSVVHTAFTASPIGVWVNQNKTVLIIVGSVAALGTGAALYLTKTGDSMVKPLQGLGKTIEIGNIKVTPKLTSFVPSQRRIGISVAAEGDFGRIAWKNSVSGVTVPGAGQIKGDCSYRFVLDKNMKLTATGMFDVHLGDPKLLDPKFKAPSGPNHLLSPGTGKLALGLDYTNSGFKLGILGSITPTTRDLTTSLGYSNVYGRHTISFDASAAFANSGLTSLNAGVSATSKQPFGQMGLKLQSTMTPQTGWGGMITFEIRR